MKKTFLIPVMTLLVCGFIYYASDTMAETKILKFAHPAPAKSDMGQTFDWWANEVGKRSGGRVKVEVYPMQSLVKMPQAWDAVSTGVADITFLDTLVFAKRIPLTSVLILPSVTFPLTNAGMIATGDAFMQLYKKFPSFRSEYKGFRLIMCPGAHGGELISKKEIRVPKDLKGMKVGSTGITAQIIEACGGVPVSVLPPEAYMSMERGVIDAIYFHWILVMARQMHEVASYFLEYNFTHQPVPVVINDDSWKSLPADVQKIIEDLQPEATRFRANLNDKLQAISKKKWTEAGNKIIQLNSDEKKLWVEKTNPFEGQWLAAMKAAGKEEAKDILSELKRLSNEAWK